MDKSVSAAAYWLGVDDGRAWEPRKIEDIVARIVADCGCSEDAARSALHHYDSGWHAGAAR